MLPLVHADHARARLHGTVGLVLRIGRFDAQHALVVRHVEIPTVRPAVFAEANNAALPQFTGPNPRRHREIARADIHRGITRHHHRVVAPIQFHRLPERTVHKLRAAHQFAGQNLGPAQTVRVTLQLPGADEFLIQLRGIRLDLRVGRFLQKHIDLIQTRLAHLNRARPHGTLHREHAVGRLRPCRTALQQQGVVILRRLHAHSKLPVLGQLAQGDFEIRARSVGAFHLPHLRTGNGLPQKQTVFSHLIRLAQRISPGTAHAGEDGVVNAIVFAPAAHGAVALIAFVEAPLRAHLERRKGKRLFRHQLAHNEIVIG